MNARALGLASMVLLGCLAACRGAVQPRTYAVCMSARPCFDPSKDPYWEDPIFEKSLLDAIQAVVHDPVDAADMSSPGLHATVKFTLLDGVIEYPEITQSTGDPEKDKLILHQLASAQPPKATGPQSDQPHQFVLDVDMPTPFEAFESTLYGAIEYQKVYPKDPIIAGITGDTAVDFDYQDGKTSNIELARSSNSKSLDQASLGAVKRATFPPAQSAYIGKSLHMEVVFCYTMVTNAYGRVTEGNACPTGRNVIVVQGERFTRTSVQVVPTGHGYR